MKIKLALLDSDQNYLNRIVTAFNIKYADKLEIYSFTKLESAMAALEPSRIDVLVASDTFVVESSALPKRCQLAYFVDGGSRGRLASLPPGRHHRACGGGRRLCGASGDLRRGQAGRGAGD